MDYDASDSSGTDDDIPPSHQNRGAREPMTRNGRTAAGAPLYPGVQNDMETEIHRLEQEAYSSVVWAFKAQADAITWEQESLMTELRKELRISVDEHRELLSKVNADDIIRRIREWRHEGGLVSGLLNNSQPVYDSALSPTVSASRKRQNTSLSLGAPTPLLHSQGVVNSLQPSSTPGKFGVVPGSKGKKPKSGQIMPGGSTLKSLQYPSTAPSGRGQITNTSSGVVTCDLLIGRKVMTRWPEDNNFYDAVITDYNPDKGLHALVYDMNTNNETWEWVNLKEISPEDIRWEGGDPGIANQAYRGGPGRGINKSIGRGGATRGVGRGRAPMKTLSNRDLVPSQNGVGKKGSEDIEILQTEILIKEVEQRVFGSSHPDPFQVEKMKKILKEHEQSLTDVISRLANASDGESEGGEDRFSRRQPMDRERVWKNRDYAETTWG